MVRFVVAAGVAAAFFIGQTSSAGATTADGVASGVPRFVHYAVPVGAAAPTQHMYLVVHLAYPNPSAVDRFVRVVHDPVSPEYQHFLTPAQFAAAFAPSPQTYGAVAMALQREGLRIYRTYANRKVIDVVGDVRHVQAAFGTPIEMFASQGRFYYANAMPARIPPALRGAVEAVSGFNDHDSMTPRLSVSGSTQLRRLGPNPNGGLNAAPAGQFGPLEVETAYDYPITHNPAINGSGPAGIATIAIETAYDYLDNDLQDYWTMFNVPRSLTPGPGQGYVFRQIVDCPQCQGQGVPAPEEALETTADVEQSSSNAPGANVLVVEATNNLTSSFDDVYAATVQDPRVDVVTTSWGLCESDENSNEMFADNDLFKQGAAEGQTFFVASGDNGSSGSCSAVANGPIFPASSQYATGSGGTDLALNSNLTWKSETADPASGGGVSVFFGLPSFQAGIPGLQSASGRNVPDVALNYLNYVFCYGDVTGAQGCAINKALIVNGTSIVAPNMAAAYAAFDAYYGKRLGNAATGLYNGFVKHTYPYSPVGKHPCLAWHDIVTGSNGIYSAHTAYDAVTGVGSLDMYCYMLQLPHASGQSL